jgi:hypothetical protein
MRAPDAPGRRGSRSFATGVRHPPSGFVWKATQLGSFGWVRSDGFVRIPGRSRCGAFDPAWVRSDSRELRVRLALGCPHDATGRAGGVDDRVGNSARRHASARSWPSLCAPTAAGACPTKSKARAWRLPGRVGRRRRTGWEWRPNLLPSGDGTQARGPGDPTLDMADSLFARWATWKLRGSLRPGPSSYAIVGT